ncbi:MAG: carbohydrate kinase [Chloroflexi bacterium]|nr:carbohydrate kinase [Chloroflexota bacterium]
MNSKNIDIMMIGHVTRDRLVINGRTETGAGGAVYYGSIPLSRLGVSTLVVTRLHPGDKALLADMRAAGVQVHAIASDHTSEMENVYQSADQERRQARALNFAGSYNLRDIPDVHPRVILITPLAAGEVDLDLLRALAKRGIIALDVQGFVRVREGEQLVFRDWSQKRIGLAHVRFLKLDLAEGEVLTGFQDPQCIVETVANWGPREVMLTYPGAVMVYAEGHIYQAPIAPRRKNGRTGRGDTCFATYIGCRLRMEPPEAVRFAAALTSLKLEKPGPWKGNVASVEEWLTGKMTEPKD